MQRKGTVILCVQSPASAKTDGFKNKRPIGMRHHDLKKLANLRPMHGLGQNLSCFWGATTSCPLSQVPAHVNLGNTSKDCPLFQALGK